MSEIKEKIKQHFSRASRGYENAAFVQQESAQFLVDQLCRNCTHQPQTVLDLGTGTGCVASFLLKRFPQSRYTLNDISPEMLRVCRHKLGNYNNVTFLLGDMEEIDCGEHDLVVSNLALQWTRNLPQTIKKFHEKSNIFLFSTLLQGTFKEWQNKISPMEHKELPPQKYPSEGEMVDWCLSILGKDRQLYYWIRKIPVTFKSPLSFMKYLQNLGANVCSEQMTLRTIRSLVRRTDEKLVVTYIVFFALLKRAGL